LQPRLLFSRALSERRLDPLKKRHAEYPPSGFSILKPDMEVESAAAHNATAWSRA
jgi:hypothetical protein